MPKNRESRRNYYVGERHLRSTIHTYYSAVHTKLSQLRVQTFASRCHWFLTHNHLRAQALSAQCLKITTTVRGITTPMLYSYYSAVHTKLTDRRGYLYLFCKRSNDIGWLVQYGLANDDALLYNDSDPPKCNEFDNIPINSSYCMQYSNVKRVGRKRSDQNIVIETWRNRNLSAKCER